MENSSHYEVTLLKAHFDVIPFDIYVVDVATYEIIFTNRVITNRLGDVVGQTCYQTLYQREAPCLFCKIPQLVDAQKKPNGSTVIFENFHDLEDRWYQFQEKAIGWPDGRVVKYSIAVDISELKLAQNKLAEAHAELALKNKELVNQNSLLSENIKLREEVERITRHDLKSPLTAVISLSELLLCDYNLTPELQDVIAKISESGLTMLKMINQSLDLYKLERGSYALAPAPMDIFMLIRKAIFDQGRIISSKSLRITYRANGLEAPSDFQVFILGEELLCYSLFANLIINALEAAPARSEILFSITSDQPEHPQMVLIEISNQGEVPVAIRHNFFDKYITSGKIGGTGLGTYSAMLIAKAHGGMITLDTSAPGQTTLRVAFPKASD